MLYVVSTPIGNLEDITLRALRVLKESDLIAAEDTRQTRKLLSHHQIKTDITSFNDINKGYRAKQLLDQMKSGKSVALVSDAGTPGISDPGFYLVRECVKAKIKVIPVPGPTAMISALVCSGLATDRFSFRGFIPKKDKGRSDFLKEISENPETTIIYESPHRLIKTLHAMAELLPNHEIVIARELTKIYEEFLRGKPAELLAHFEQHEPKGEFVIIIGPAPQN